MAEALDLFAILMAIFVPISMLVFISGYFDYKKKTRDRLGSLQKQLDQQSTEELRAELGELKERIVVLESIVTDRNYELDRQISSL